MGFSMQDGREQKPLESHDQCLVSKYVLLCPDSILAWQQAFSPSYVYGLLPAEVQIGWGLVRE